MAARGRRLGALLTTGPLEGDLIDAVRLLASVPSPRGHERALAQAVVDFGAARWPAAQWSVQDVDDAGSPCAQVVATYGNDEGGLLLYSHLDTSLTGDPGFDTAITGRPGADSGFTVDLPARTLHGFGLGVAKGPAAAALVAFGGAGEDLSASGRRYGLRLLLAARGTHRAPFGAVGELVGPSPRTGVERYLADAALPTAAVVAKGGPTGVLHDEPGACYVRVTFRSGWGAVMSRAAVRPPGGVLAHLDALVPAVADVGDAVARLLADQQPSGQAGAGFGIGAVRGGQPTKADLVPGAVDVVGYLVGPGTLDVERIRTVFDAALREALAGLDGIDVAVDVSVIHDGGSTPSDAAVVRAAVDAWRADQEEHGVLAEPAAITGWTGSTDGVVLRAAGVATVRLGPSRTRAVGDGTDVADLDELLAFTRIYRQLALRRAET